MTSFKSKSDPMELRNVHRAAIEEKGFKNLSTFYIVYT
jgi:hypothetical protein